MTFGQLFFALSIGRHEQYQTRTLFSVINSSCSVIWNVLSRYCIMFWSVFFLYVPSRYGTRNFKWLVENSRGCSIFVIHFWFLGFLVQSIYARFIYDGFTYGFRWFPGCGNLVLVLQSRKLAKRGKFYMLCYICKFASFMISFTWFAWYMVIVLW